MQKDFSAMELISHTLSVVPPPFHDAAGLLGLNTLSRSSISLICKCLYNACGLRGINCNVSPYYTMRPSASPRG